MANEYAVNSADLAAVADAIRAKGGTEEQLSFPDEFVTAIENLSSGSVIGDRKWLYHEGDICEDTTGGWMGVTNPFGSFGVKYPTLTKNESSMALSVPSPNGHTGTIRTILPVDLTDYDYLEFEFDRSGSNWGYLVVRSSESGDIRSNNAASTDVDATTGTGCTKILDISNISGLFYVFIGQYHVGVTTIHNLSAVRSNV